MLSQTHPSRVIRGCARHLRATLVAHRIFGKVRFADLTEAEGNTVGHLCDDIEHKSDRLKVVVADAASDGVFTAAECDNIVHLVDEIEREAEDGRAE